MERQGIHDINLIIQRIEAVETMLLQQLSQLKENIPEKKREKQMHDKEKYCHFHMTATYSSSDCKALKRKKLNSNNMITERNPTIKSLTIPINIQGRTILATLDTGATGNYIRRLLIKNTQSKNIQYEKQQRSSAWKWSNNYFRTRN